MAASVEEKEECPVNVPSRVLVHGEPEGSAALRDAIQKQYGVEAVAPGWGQSFELG